MTHSLTADNPRAGSWVVMILSFARLILDAQLTELTELIELIDVFLNMDRLCIVDFRPPSRIRKLYGHSCHEFMGVFR